MTLGELQKDENDVPCPFDGHYWSLTHKSKYVAAVVGKDKIGIDIEEIKPRSKAIFSLVASDEEWERAQDRSLDTFLSLLDSKRGGLESHRNRHRRAKDLSGSIGSPMSIILSWTTEITHFESNNCITRITSSPSSKRTTKLNG